MNFQLAHGDEIIKCPYDKCHVVLKDRMFIHVMKCRVRYEATMREAGKEIKMARCRHNWKHKIIGVEKKFHEEFCSDREKPHPNMSIEQHLELLRVRNQCVAPLEEVLGCKDFDNDSK